VNDPCETRGDGTNGLLVQFLEHRGWHGNPCVSRGEITKSRWRAKDNRRSMAGRFGRSNEWFESIPVVALIFYAYGDILLNDRPH
jgi:hypothetical protein